MDPAKLNVFKTVKEITGEKTKRAMFERLNGSAPIYNLIKWIMRRTVASLFTNFNLFVFLPTQRLPDDSNVAEEHAVPQPL